MTLTHTDKPAVPERLWDRQYLGTAFVIAGGTVTFATNNYVASSLLPSVLADIGGQDYYAWTTTAFLVASVFAAMIVSRLLAARGTRGGMLLGLTVFAVGSLLCALSPSIWVLIVARLVQGFGGGLIAGLALVVMRVVLPQGLWAPMLAVLSAMWGIGNIAGPGLGGAFAQIHQWRLGFSVMVIVAVAIALLALRAVPATRAESTADPLPIGSLALMTVAATAVSLAGVVPKGGPTVAAILVGLVLVAGFLLRERVAAARILPKMMFESASAFRWCYVGIAGLTVGLSIETFVPLFGQRLGGLSPLAAGFLGAAFSAGWTVAQLASGRASGERAIRALRVAGPVMLVGGLAATALLQSEHAGPARLLGWVGTMMISGAGIGVAYSRFAFPAMASSEDSGESNKAAAALGIVQTLTTAFGSAVGGVLVNLGEPSTVDAARLLYAGVAVLAIFSLVAGLRLRRTVTV